MKNSGKTVFLTPGSPFYKLLFRNFRRASQNISHMETFSRFNRALGIALKGKIYLSDILRKICNFQRAGWPHTL